jgi:hypothetical protein
MNKKDILLVGVGALVGYFLVGFINKNKANKSGLPDTSTQTAPPATGGETLVDPKLTLCEEEWAKISATMRPASGEQLKAKKDAFIADCLAK